MRAIALVSAVVGVSIAGGIARAETLEHVVQQGETLWSIAALRDTYEDPYLWPLIYKFNRDQIKDPSRIYPSQRLQIPMHVDESARRSARLEASEHAAGQRPEETP